MLGKTMMHGLSASAGRPTEVGTGCPSCKIRRMGMCFFFWRGENGVFGVDGAGFACRELEVVGFLCCFEAAVFRKAVVVCVCVWLIDAWLGLGLLNISATFPGFP